jgi:predicted AlkP superfamily pyrophosphatase or phosphodiesterase
VSGTGPGRRPQRKLVLCVVDSLRTDMLLEAAAGGAAPTFAELLERGELITDCVASFPSVTPVCCSDLVTGHGPDRHWISGSNWYHRAEQRYVEYGSSFEATRAFGLFRALYDIVYNMNMSHLSTEVATIFERLGDAGIRTACTPFLIYRGRTRHEVGLEGLMRRVALAASFRHATWGPDELFYGELYSSRPVACKPTLARPGTRDEYSACAGRTLVDDDLYDFLLFSLPDNDHHSHRFGPEAQIESIARADAAFTELVDAAGGLDSFLDEHAVILVADHAQTRVEQPLPLIEALAETWRVLRPNEPAEHAEIAVSPIARAGAVHVLADGVRGERVRDGVREQLTELDGVELVARLQGERAVVERGGLRLRFQPGRDVVDARGEGWAVEGDLETLDAEVRDGRLVTAEYPDALARLWSALRAPRAGDLLLSAAPGYEVVDWGGVTHCPGGSHGALRAGDSLGPLLLCGFEPGTADRREQWALRDVAGLVMEHFFREEETRATLTPVGSGAAG